MFGFTLIEIIITLFIAMLLVVLVVPSQKMLVNKAEDQTASSQLLRAINLTRTEAIMRGKPIVLCKSADLKSCSGEWKDGYIIVSDNQVLFSFQQNLPGTLYWRAFPYLRNYLQFLPSGLPTAENGTFWYCKPEEKNPSWAIVMNQSGRSRIVLPDANGKIIDDKKHELLCS